MSSRWLGYHRISRVGDRPDTPVSEGEAERTVRDYAERKGLTVEMLPVEKNISGGKMQRPILGSAIEAIEGGQAAGIIVPYLDRLSRAELVDALTTIQRIEDAGGQVRSVREDFDVSMPEGRQARNMSLLMASGDLDRKKLYIRASKRSAVARGVWPFPKPPLGYAVTRRRDGGDGRLVPDLLVAPRVVAAFEARARGESWAKVAAGLGVGLSNAGKIIRNVAYLGSIKLTMADGEEFVNHDAHPPLVDRPLWQAAQVDHPPPAKKGNPRALLAGLGVCAACGGRMTPNTDTRSRNYRCTGMPRAGGKKCPAPAIIGKAKVEDYVIAAVLPHLAEMQSAARAKTDHLKDLEAALRAAEDERDAYLTVTRVSDIGMEAFKAGVEPRQQAVAKAAADLAHARAQLPTIPGGRNVAEMWEGFDTERRRVLLSGALAGVVVHKGRGPAEGRVRVIARGFELPDFPVAGDADLEGEIRPVSGENPQ